MQSIFCHVRLSASRSILRRTPLIAIVPTLAPRLIIITGNAYSHLTGTLVGRLYRLYGPAYLLLGTLVL